MGKVTGATGLEMSPLSLSHTHTHTYTHTLIVVGDINMLKLIFVSTCATRTTKFNDLFESDPKDYYCDSSF